MCTNNNFSLASPMILRNIIISIEDQKRGFTEGFSWCLCLFLSNLLSYLANSQYNFYQERTSLRLRCLLSSMIYRKGLRLSSRAAMKRSPAEVVNHISIDSSKVGYGFYYLNYIYSGPVTLISM